MENNTTNTTDTPTEWERLADDMTSREILRLMDFLQKQIRKRSNATAAAVRERRSGNTSSPVESNDNPAVEDQAVS